MANLLTTSLASESKDSMSQAFRSTRVVTGEGLAAATLVVEDERIVAVRSWGDAPRSAVLHDFGDRVLLPGLVDTHVHINDPGRAEWEGFETATRAAVAGGVTTLVDMPLNCIPETTDVEALEAKRAAARGRTWADWSTWGGVVRGNSEALHALAVGGVAGYKCFLIDSGVDGFAWVDEAELRLALDRLKTIGLPLLAHAEIAGPVENATAKLDAANADWRKYSTYLASRPDEAETEAIGMLIALAEEFKAHIHIVHLSSAKALPLLAEARLRGVPVTVETCAHYLWFAGEEIGDGATEFKCAPPIRDAANREALWKALEAGLIDMVATDHSPCPPVMKHKDEGRWDRAWGGIASLGLALQVVWTGLLKRGYDEKTAMERTSKWMCTWPARLAGLAGQKGALVTGADADIVVFDPDAAWTVGSGDLHFRHRTSPYLGSCLRGRVMETWLRGERIYGGDGWAGTARGRGVRR